MIEESKKVLVRISKEMINVFVDGVRIEVAKGSTVLKACEKGGMHLPRFCYHERLLIAGNCRLCLVEVEGRPKPIIGCAEPVSMDMKIFTSSSFVRSGREGILEFLLKNHPLDCPICDQGGECDLQDQSMEFGGDRGRMVEERRVVSDKNLGVLIDTAMKRCIQCTRCVRFVSEVCGGSLGMVSRGVNSEISKYKGDEKSMKATSFAYLSGNLIDLCPVGWIK